MFENGEKFFSQTRFGKSKIDSWLPGFFIVIGTFFLGQIISAVILVVALIMENPDLFDGKFDAGSFQATFKNAIAGSPLLYAVLLVSFLFPFFATFFVVKSFHNRFARTVLTAASRFRWKRCFTAAAITFLAAGGLAAFGHVMGFAPIAFTFDANVFFFFAIVSLLLIPFQSAAEEIVVRGYFNQGIGHYVNNKWVVFVITSALFALLHLANPESQSGAEAGASQHLLVMGAYFMFGFLLSVIVYFEGGLEAVIGVHIANNLFVAVFVNYEGSALPTPTVFMAPASDGLTAFVSTVLYMSIIGVILYWTKEELPEIQAENITLKPDVQHL